MTFLNTSYTFCGNDVRKLDLREGEAELRAESGVFAPPGDALLFEVWSFVVVIMGVTIAPASTN